MGAADIPEILIEYRSNTQRFKCVKFEVSCSSREEKI
jgi:hypothetical protein